MNNISLIGAGEVGRTWAQAITSLKDSSYLLTLIDPFPPADTVAWAQDAGVLIHSQPSALPESGIVLLFVPGTLQPHVVEEIAGHVHPGTTIVDLSTASPEAKHAAAELLAARGVEYIDIAIVGVVAVSKVRTPLLIASEAAEPLESLLNELEVPRSYLEGAGPGDAVRVKLLRSVITKGIETLAVEVLPAARRYGLLDQLFVALSDVDSTPFENLLRNLIVTHAGHASRRDAEIKESIRLLEAIGGAATMTRAVSERYNETIRLTEKAGHKSGASFDEALIELSADLEPVTSQSNGG